MECHLLENKTRQEMKSNKSRNKTQILWKKKKLIYSLD